MVVYHRFHKNIKPLLWEVIIIRKTSWAAKQHIISEVSCDTGDWSNFAVNWALHHRKKTQNRYFKLNCQTISRPVVNFSLKCIWGAKFSVNKQIFGGWTTTLSMRFNMYVCKQTCRAHQQISDLLLISSERSSKAWALENPKKGWQILWEKRKMEEMNWRDIQ